MTVIRLWQHCYCQAICVWQSAASAAKGAQQILVRLQHQHSKTAEINNWLEQVCRLVRRVPWSLGSQAAFLSCALLTSDDRNTHLQLFQGLGTVAKAVMAPPQLNSVYKALWGDLSCTLKACQSLLKGRRNTAPG